MKDWCPCLRFHNLILMFTLHSVRIVCESIVRIFHTWETENTWKMTNGSKHLCPLSLSSFVHYHLGFTFFLGLKLTGSMLIVSSWSHDIVIFISKWFCVLIRFHARLLWSYFHWWWWLYLDVCVCRNLASFDYPGREETWAVTLTKEKPRKLRNGSSPVDLHSCQLHHQLIW